MVHHSVTVVVLCCVLAPLLITPVVPFSGMKLPAIADRGRCARLGLIENFNFTRYSGRWSVVMEVTGMLPRHPLCNAIYMAPIDNEGEFSLTGTELVPGGSAVENTANLRYIDPKVVDPYILIRATKAAPAVKYHIVETDYHRYSCVYSCISIFGFRVELFWIMTRELSSAQFAKDRCLDLFVRSKVNITKLSDVQMIQDECLGLPEEEVVSLNEIIPNLESIDDGQTDQNELDPEKLEAELRNLFAPYPNNSTSVTFASIYEQWSGVVKASGAALVVLAYVIITMYIAAK